jgi:hypothetical protein
MWPTTIDNVAWHAGRAFFNETFHSFFDDLDGAGTDTQNKRYGQCCDNRIPRQARIGNGLKRRRQGQLRLASHPFVGNARSKMNLGIETLNLPGDSAGVLAGVK